MQEGIKYVISADVKQAVSGFKQLESNLIGLSKGVGIAALGVAAMGLKLAVIDPLVSSLKEEFQDLQQEFIDSIDPMRKYGEAIKSVSDGVVKNTGSVVQLVAALESGKLSYEQTVKAQDALIKQAPVFKGAFDENGKTVSNLSDILQKQYIPSLINTIKTTAATEIINKKLKKSFETIANQGEVTAFQTLINGLKNVGLAGFTSGFFIDQTVQKYKNLKKAQDELNGDNVSALISQTYKDLGITFTDFGLTLDNAKGKTEKHTKALKEHRKAVDEVELGYIKINNALENYIKNQIKAKEELNGFKSEVLKNAKDNIPQPGTNGIEVDGFNFGGSFEPATKELDKMLISAKQLSDTINNGIGGGIDTFFNALANNQDPFKALAQSVQRLVVELAAAVVKMLVIKALANLIAPGVGGKAAAAGLNAGILRGAVLGR
jgi:hypothetical protein